MTDSIDFSGAKLEDFKVLGGEQNVQSEPAAQPVAEPVAEPTPAEPVAEPATQAEPVAQTTPQPESKAEPAKEFQFKDDFIKQVVEFYEKTGDLTPYLQAKTVDFTKMSDEEIMRRSLREQYSDLSEKAFDRLYKQQVIDKYKLDADEWGEEDSELGRELLKVEASKTRSQYLDWQNNFKAPEPAVDTNAQADQLEALQKFESEVRSSEYTRSLLEGKKLTIKTTDGEFNYEVPNVEPLLDMTVNNDLFFSQFATEQGTLDYAKWYKTAAYSQDPEMFERSLINYGKTLGRSEVTKEIKNPSSSQVGDVPTEGSGDFRTGLLQAFAARGIQK
jgi:hypothetical protein